MTSSTSDNQGSVVYNPLPGSLTIRYDEETIEQRIEALGREINEAYQNHEKLVIIAILKGSFMFLSDLIKKIDVPCQVEFVRLSSYGNTQQSSGEVSMVDLSLPNLAGEDVLIIEDIVDTGLTMKFFTDYLKSLHHIKSLKLAVMLDKPEARKNDIQADFVGFTVGNEFLVGYGLDYAGFYRNLPYIGVVNSEQT